MSDNREEPSLAQIIEALKASPLFSLSLSSKELFHSNFLAWLCETYPVIVGRLLSECLTRRPTTAVVVKALREWKNLDLVLEYPGGELVIENKV
jgi:hypothetical protein